MSIAAAKNVQAFNTDMVEVTCSSQLFCRSSTPSSWARVSISKTPPSCKTIYINVKCQRWSNTAENKSLIIIHQHIVFEMVHVNAEHIAQSAPTEIKIGFRVSRRAWLTNFVYKSSGSIYSWEHSTLHSRTAR